MTRCIWKTIFRLVESESASFTLFNKNHDVVYLTRIQQNIKRKSPTQLFSIFYADNNLKCEPQERNHWLKSKFISIPTVDVDPVSFCVFHSKALPDLGHKFSAERDARTFHFKEKFKENLASNPEN